LEPQKLQALELLLLGKSNSAVARALEVDRSTIARWRQEPEFAELYQSQKSELQTEVKERLSLLMNEAIDVCQGALEAQDTKVAMKILERFDKQQEKEEDKDSLPRLIVNLVENPPMPIMTLDEMIAYNKSLPGPDPEFIELSERIRQKM
jgi:transposase